MATWQTTVVDVMKSALVDKVDRDHRQSDRAFLRRRIVVGVTLVVGAVLLGVSLSVSPGDNAFYPLTIALAATWIIGGFVSGPLHLGRITFNGSMRRPIITPILIGLAAGGVFVVGGLVVRQIPPLADFVANVLAHATMGSMGLIVFITLLNGVAEEIFFRGALFAAIGRRKPVLISTLVYTVVTLASGNPMLAFAAITLGFVLALQRRSSGGILAPMLTHVAWSTVMVFALPPLFV
ncbi:CPBP family intramembrane metalloprotease [Rhodococcus sp. 14-2470-1b]|jgi:membrane protease YdiL (CAAX protease family)|uniref:CPBP family intramembrane glutamic endopeptidase n=1 Tax=Rhodococcus sp. 14-2470-1b TaxID=2023149 RepID=UPI000B9A55AF|nr:MULTISPECIES: type II CAAX endopeptidase family protein [unclassified Rhodococcus (in: high G+C Gram-positive bacteria)]OZD71986.1 CPBP family intramembrane metalloprotease [Rhodococcus sp. 06-1059B-a]OZF58635.1 CPBP family intramembrane metalloprotease [Rhodococcus sp. 14-2470-1b]